jgi:ABC-2 type transport system permease protein
MRTAVFSIFSREIRSYFFSMSAYVLATIFLLLSGYFFATAVTYYSLYSFQLSQQPGLAAQGLNLTEAVIGNLFFNFSVILLLMMPVLAMRTLAEEQKQGTLELLLTYPVNEWELVAAKFLSAFCVLLMMLTPLLVDLFLLQRVGGMFEWGVVFSGFLGLLLLAMAFIALGIFTSSLTENQVVSAAMSFGFLLLLWVIGWLSRFLPYRLGGWVDELSLLRHSEGFFKGLIQLKHVLFYALFTLFFLFLAVWRLETRKWVH